MKCNQCDDVFSRIDALKRHTDTVHNKRLNHCVFCGKSFTRKYGLKTHLLKCVVAEEKKQGEQKVPTMSLPSSALTSSASTSSSSVRSSSLLLPSSSTSKIMCDLCNMEVSRRKWKQHQRSNLHKLNVRVLHADNVYKIVTSFKERIVSYSVVNEIEEDLNVKSFFMRKRAIIKNLLEDKLIECGSIKFNLELFAEFMKLDKENEMDFDVKSMIASMRSVLMADDLENVIMEMEEKIMNKLEEFQEQDSGWTLIRIKTVEVNINKYQCLRGSRHFKLPDFINNKKAVINVQNNDVYCFKWAIISAVNPNVLKPNSMYSYKINDITSDSIYTNNITLNFKDLVFPLGIDQIKKFEMQNEISVNIFGYSKDDKNNECIEGPYYLTKKEQKFHVNLLMCEENEVFHYVWIKCLSRLLRDRILEVKEKKLYFCNSCLHHYYNKESLKKHKNECSHVVTTMPKEKENIIKFKNVENSVSVPFVIYADFESILMPVSSCFPDPSISSTTTTQQHVPCAFSYYVNCFFDKSKNFMRTFTGEKKKNKK